MELTEVLEFSRADMTRIVSLRLKEDREKRGTTALLRERVALKGGTEVTVLDVSDRIEEV